MSPQGNFERSSDQSIFFSVLWISRGVDRKIKFGPIFVKCKQGENADRAGWLDRFRAARRESFARKHSLIQLIHIHHTIVELKYQEAFEFYWGKRLSGLFCFWRWICRMFSLLKTVKRPEPVPMVDPMTARCLSNFTEGGIDAVHAEALCSTSGSAVRNASGFFCDPYPVEEDRIFA
jgi:hypothetical protein